MALACFAGAFFQKVEIGAKLFNFVSEIHLGEVKHELYRQVFEDIQFIHFTVSIHVEIYQVLGRDLAVTLKVIDHAFTATVT